MKRMIAGRIARLTRKSLDSENGIALVAALVILTVLALLGVSAIITSQIDVQIAGNEKVSLQSLHAAEAGLSQALIMMNEVTAAGPKIVDPSPVSWGDADNGWSRNVNIALTDENGNAFFDVAVTVGYKTDGSCQTVANQVAFYNQTCGFTDSINSTGGAPVYLVNSVASKGDYRSALALELTKQELNYQIKGGFTANGNVGLTGNIRIDGRDHGLDGSTASASCSHANLTGSKPAIHSDGTITSGGSATIVNGSSANNSNSPGTPWDALGLNEAQFNEMFSNKVTSRVADGTLSGYMWVNGNFGTGSAAGGSDIGGNGILVVHNENFDSAKWDKWNTDPDYKAAANCSGADAGDEIWCAAYRASESTYRPARLGNVNGGTFNGIIIADWVDSIQGNLTINGAIVSLTTIATSNIGAGTATINYSCAAIEQFAGGRVNHKLNWKRVY